MPADFYAVYSALCKDVSLSPSGAAELIGFNKGTVSIWKSKHTTPGNEILGKIARFFNVPYAFLTQTPPFDHWGEILNDYCGFLRATGLSEETLAKSWAINPSEHPRVKELVAFINDFVSEIRYTDGNWTVISKAQESSPATRDIYTILNTLKSDLEKNKVFFYRDSTVTDDIRSRIIWAIQLGLDAADNLQQESIRDQIST